MVQDAQAGRDFNIQQFFGGILPVSSVPSALHQLPPPPRDFTGRIDELVELTAAIEKGGASILSLRGMAGIGKTTLARRAAERFSPRYPDAQFDLDLRGASPQPLSAAYAMGHVIRAYHPTEKLPEGEAEMAALYRSVLHGQRALLLMDNAASREQVEPLIPPASCLLLITSRFHFTLPGLFGMNLGTLAPEDARTLLLTISPRIGDHADELMNLCGHLPLALRLAASVLAERLDLSPAEYNRRLTDARERLELIDASLSLSYDLLRSEMKKLWCSLAVFPDTFDVSAVANVWGAEAEVARDTLSALVAYSMVEWNPTTTRYGLHDLVRLFADSRLGQSERLLALKHHAVHYLDVLGAADQLYEQGGEFQTDGLAQFDLELRNIQAGQDWAQKYAKEDNEAASICIQYPNAGAELLILRQHPLESIRWLEAAIESARLQENRVAEGAHLGSLGTAWARRGEMRHAIASYEQAALILREVGTRAHEGGVLLNLGIAHRNLGELDRAVAYYEAALAIFRDIKDRRYEGTVLGNLGLAVKELGDDVRAIELHNQYLTIAREVGDRQGESIALGALGNAHYQSGDYRRAIEFHERSLSIAREIGDRHGEGIAFGNLGAVYDSLGDRSIARGYFTQHLAIARETGDQRGEGTALFNLSLSLNGLGDRAQAISHSEAALDIFEAIESPLAARVRDQLVKWLGQN
ncbi:MAG TPA: tetratricopeptide repeat protein [Blastocatellia bacterium]|nr:tetratricopeptide repeat protein [Blastocatellia bacterium]